jgi:hypothetical protein
MFKTLFKVAVVAGAVAGGVHLWRKYEVTSRLTAFADDLLTKFVVGQEEKASQEIRHEEDFLSALREQRDAASHRS